jgi:hypothetical protein
MQRYKRTDLSGESVPRSRWRVLRVSSSATRVSLSRYIIRVRSMTSYENAGRISQRVPATHIASEIEILY